MPRPRSESFYLNLAPNISAALSIQTKASLSLIRSPPPPPSPSALTSPTSPTRPFPRTPSIRTVPVALPDDADDERDAPPRNQASAQSPLLKKRSGLAQPLPRYPWSPKAPSPLRRDASKPFCPSSLFINQTALLPLYPIASTTTSPRPVPELSQDHPPLNTSHRPRTPLYIGTLKKSFFAGPEGSSARRFGVRTAWNIHEDVRHSLASDQLHSIFDFSSSDEDDLAPHDHPSNIEIEHAVNQPISQVHTYPGLPPVAAPNHHKRSPSDHSDEDASSGSDGGDGYSSGPYDDESSSDEEQSLSSENEDIWDVISI